MKKIILLMWVSLTVVNAASYKLSLEEFVGKALKYNPSIKNILAEKHNITPNYILDKELEDIILSVGLGNTFLLSSSRLSNPVLSLTVNKFLGSTGTSFSTSYTKSLSSTNQEQHKFSSSFTQPLIRNNFGLQYNLQEKSRLLTMHSTQLEIMEIYEDYVLGLINQYYDWYVSYLEMNAAIELLSKYEQLLQDINERKKNHIAREIDVNKVRLQVLGKRENVLDKKNAYNQKKTDIINELFIAHNENILPILPASLSEVQNNNQEIIKKSRTQIIMNIAEKISSIDLLIAKDNLNAEVNLEAEYSHTHYPANNSNNSSTAYAGITMPFPIYDRQDEATYMLNDIDHRVLLMTHNQERIDKKINLSKIEKNIELQIKYIDIYQRKIKYLKAIAKAEKADYLLGKATLNALIQALSNLENTEKSLLENQVSLEKLKWEWFSLTDQLLNFY